MPIPEVPVIPWSVIVIAMAAGTVNAEQKALIKLSQQYHLRQLANSMHPRYRAAWLALLDAYEDEITVSNHGLITLPSALGGFLATTAGPNPRAGYRVAVLAASGVLNTANVNRPFPCSGIVSLEDVESLLDCSGMIVDYVDLDEVFDCSGVISFEFGTAQPASGMLGLEDAALTQACSGVLSLYGTRETIAFSSGVLQIPNLGLGLPCSGYLEIP